MRSFAQLRGERLGFRPDQLVAFTFPIKKANPWEAWDALAAAVRTVPGVTSVGVASALPFESPSWTPRVQRADVPDRGTFYRVRVGPFSQADAQRLCDDLRQAGGDCVLAKR